MQRVVVVGRGGAGKTTGAVQLGRLTGLPVIELDKYFWSADLEPTAPDEWVKIQRGLAAAEKWVMDGDLGPYDVVAPRLTRADAVIVFDFGLPRCAWRALRRSRERADFWWWLVTWRRRYRPMLLQAVATHAARAQLHVIKSPRQWRALMGSAQAGIV